MNSHCEFQAGAASADITPQEPLLLRPTGMMRRHPPRGVLDPLRAEALALRLGGELVVVLTADLTTIPLPWVREIESRLVERHSCRVLFSSVHNHCSTPEAAIDSPAAGAALERAQERIVDGWVQAAEQAVATLRPAECGAATARLDAPVGENRRARLSNGTCVMRWGSGPVVPFGQRLASPAGADAREIEVLAFREPGGAQPFAVLTSYDSHIHLTGIPYFSGEVPGAAKRELEARMPDCTALYATGAAGDVACNSGHPIPSSEEGELEWFKSRQTLLGLRFADAVSAALGRIRYEKPRVLRHAFFSTETERTHPDGRRTILNAVGFGDVVLLSLPGELFIEVGRRLRAQCPYPHLFLLGYNGSRQGYVPLPLGFEQGGYEVIRGPAPSDASDTEPMPVGIARVETAGEILRQADTVFRRLCAQN